MEAERLLDQLAKIATGAGQAILDVYNARDFSAAAGARNKHDDSPLTEADLAANRIIVEQLKDAWPDIPILSEESDQIDDQVRRQWPRHFLVDPLDGTKEFISRNGEFTVNIALIESGKPVAGVVHVPVTGVTYAGVAGLDGTPVAWVHEGDGRRSIRTRRVNKQALTIVASRRHGGDELKTCLDLLGRHFAATETVNMGSSLKLCLVAAGEADFYPRLAPTAEWDTAAAHAIVLAAGGQVVDTSFRPLVYNQKADLLNPFFYVIGDVDFDWQALLGRAVS